MTEIYWVGTGTSSLAGLRGEVCQSVRLQLKRLGWAVSQATTKEKVRVHMNVVPRSTINTNGGTEN